MLALGSFPGLPIIAVHDLPPSPFRIDQNRHKNAMDGDIVPQGNELFVGQRREFEDGLAGGLFGFLDGAYVFGLRGLFWYSFLHGQVEQGFWEVGTIAPRLNHRAWAFQLRIELLLRQEAQCPKRESKPEFV